MDDILEHAPCGFLSFSDDGTVVAVNSTLSSLLGYERPELQGRHVRVILSVAGQVFYETHFFPLLMLRGAAEEIYFSLRSKNAEDVPVLANAVRRERAGRHISDCVFVPMRQRSRYEDELLCAKVAVEEAATRQRAFMRDALLSVTDGVLRLCDTPADLPTPLSPVGEPISLSGEGGVGALRHLAVAAASGAGLNQGRRDDLATAVGEAGMNAVRHAKDGTGCVGVGLKGTIQVRIADGGRGIPLEDLPNATLRKGFTTAGTLGHGMKMMLQAADRVYLLTGAAGTTVVIEQDPTPPALALS